MSARSCESVERLSKLINDVLDLTTADSRGVTVWSASGSMSPACAARRSRPHRSRAAEKAQKLEATIDPSAGFVIGDARRLRESIEHVLGNAIAYTDRKGRITLERERRRRAGRADQVSDNGSGIAAEDIAAGVQPLRPGR